MRDVMVRNPVIFKELRSRMRGWRAFAVLTAHLVFLSGFALVFYLAILAIAGQSGNGNTPVGKIFFGAVFLLELFLVSFLTPAFTAGTITGERERRTLDLLISTPLSSSRVVLGKLISALVYILLLIAVAVPLESIAFLMGGISPAEVILAQLFLILAALSFGSIGILFSSFLRNTIIATVLSYASMLLLVGGVPMLLALAIPILGTMMGGNPQLVLENPWFIYGGGFLLCTNPFTASIATEILYSSGKSLWFFNETIANNTLYFSSPWLVFTLLSVSFTALYAYLAVHFTKRKRAN